MTTVDPPAAAPPAAVNRHAPPLRRLYLVRFAFAVAWAALLFADKSHLGALGIALLVIYPLFDVAVPTSAGPVLRGRVTAFTTLTENA